MYSNFFGGGGQRGNDGGYGANGGGGGMGGWVGGNGKVWGRCGHTLRSSSTPEALHMSCP